jgi:hypothetical protein
VFGVGEGGFTQAKADKYDGIMSEKASTVLNRGGLFLKIFSCCELCIIKK